MIMLVFMQIVDIYGFSIPYVSVIFLLGVLDTSPRLPHPDSGLRGFHFGPAIFGNALQAGVRVDATNKVSHQVFKYFWPSRL